VCAPFLFFFFCFSVSDCFGGYPQPFKNKASVFAFSLLLLDNGIYEIYGLIMTGMKAMELQQW